MYKKNVYIHQFAYYDYLKNTLTFIDANLLYKKINLASNFLVHA